MSNEETGIGDLSGFASPDPAIRAKSYKELVDGLLGPIGEALPEALLLFRMALSEESDRGCALMAASYLETELGELLRAAFVENTRVASQILDGRGPVATFSARIDLAYLVGLIPEDFWHDLHIIRKIRNEFAHNPFQISFSDQKIKDTCSNLKCVPRGVTRGARASFVSSVVSVSTEILLETEVLLGFSQSLTPLKKVVVGIA